MAEANIDWSPWRLVEAQDDNGVPYFGLRCDGVLGNRKAAVTVDLRLICLVSDARLLAYLEAERLIFAEALTQAVGGE